MEGLEPGRVPGGLTENSGHRTAGSKCQLRAELPGVSKLDIEEGKWAGIQSAEVGLASELHLDRGRIGGLKLRSHAL